LGWVTLALVQSKTVERTTKSLKPNGVIIKYTNSAKKINKFTYKYVEDDVNKMDW